MRNNGIHIRIGDVLYGMMKHRVLVAVLTAAGLLLGFLLSGISFLQGEMSREYMVTSSFCINTNSTNGIFTSGRDFPNYSDITMAEKLVESVSYVMKSDKMLNGVISSLKLLGVTPKDIRENLYLSQYLDTQIVEMTLYWRSAQEGIDVMTELNRQATQFLNETMRVGSISVINDPAAEYKIGGSINMVLWGFMTLMGFGAAVGIVLLDLVVHPTLLNVQDIETEYGLDILSEIGQDPAFFSPQESILISNDRSSGIAQSFASAAHIILTRLRKKEGPQILYITSALHEEGKTSILANLAIGISDLEKRVLLVDFDMKNPSLAGLFLKNPEYDHSLNALYAGDASEIDAIITLTGYLDILPTVMDRGAIPLDSNLFSMIERIAKNYDYVLIDTPPVGISASPMSLSQLASGALFVVRYDTATMQEIQNALDRINKSGTTILGCFVNGVQVSTREINNPIKEKEKMRDAAEKAKNREDPLVSMAPIPVDPNVNKEDREVPLAIQFAAGSTDGDESDSDMSTLLMNSLKERDETENPLEGKDE